jgi:hypothetical protein
LICVIVTTALALTTSAGGQVGGNAPPTSQPAQVYLAEILFRDYAANRLVYGRKVLYPTPPNAQTTPVICFDQAGNPIAMTDPSRVALRAVNAPDGPRPGESVRYEISRDTGDPTRIRLRAESCLGTSVPLPAGREPVSIFFVSCIYRVQVIDPTQDPRDLELTVDRDLYRRRCSAVCEEFLRVQGERLAQDPEYLAGAQLLLRDPRLLARLRDRIAKMRGLSEEDLLGHGWGPVPKVISAIARTGDVSDIALLRDWMRQHPKIAEIACREAPPMARRLGIAQVRPLLVDLLDSETEPVGSAYNVRELIRLDPRTCIPQIRDHFVHAMIQAFDLDHARFSIINARLHYLQLTGGNPNNEADFRMAGDAVNSTVWLFPTPEARTAAISHMRRCITDIAHDEGR